MSKKIQTIIGLGALALVGYYLYRSSKMEDTFASNSGGLSSFSGNQYFFADRAHERQQNF